MVLQNLNNLLLKPAYYSYSESREIKVVREETSINSMTSSQIFMNYVTKQIEAIDKARVEIRQKNPNFLPHLS